MIQQQQQQHDDNRAGNTNKNVSVGKFEAIKS
jgi:hypothetical protein